MPIEALPIYHPPIVDTCFVHQIMLDDIDAMEKMIFKAVLRSEKGCCFVKMGNYTVRNVKTHYDLSVVSRMKITEYLGKLGIATRYVMSEVIPGVDEGTIYLFATNNPKDPGLTRKSCDIKIYR